MYIINTVPQQKPCLQIRDSKVFFPASPKCLYYVLFNISPKSHCRTNLTCVMSHNIRNHRSEDFGQVPFPVLFNHLSAKEN